MTGTVLSQVLPILAAPLLSRIYSPSDYGLLGLYISVTGLVTMFGTLQYSSAIVIAQDDDEVRGLIKLCLQILVIFSGISILAIFLFHNVIGTYFKSDQLTNWLWMAPFSIFLNGLSGIFNNYAIRKGYFGLVSKNRIFGAVLSTGCSLLIGYIYKTPLGLFVGLWVGQFINGIVFMFLALKISGESWAGFISADSRPLQKQYSNFPKYSLPADFINNFTNQIPLFMLNAYGSLSNVGSFNMSNRILGLPIGFISQSFGEVFRQKAAKDYRETGSCRPVFIKTFKTLGLLSILPFGILIIWGPDIFAWVLGEKWRDAGYYSQIMGIMFFFRFTVSPLTYVYYIAGRQKEDFYLHFLFLLMAYLSFYLGYQFFHTTEYSLLIFSLLYSSIYCVYLLRSYQLSVRKTDESSLVSH